MKLSDPIGRRLQQFALAQIDLAITYLTNPKPNPDEAIHETRRCVKRVRALLRLAKTQMPVTIYDRENLYLRNIGWQLTKLRDAAVMAETLAELQKEFPLQLKRREWRTLKTELTDTQRRTKLDKKKRMATVAQRLRTARTRVDKWSLEFDDDAVLRQGLRKTYQRGRYIMEEAIAKPTTENFHEWRKQVNHLRHQLQILHTLKLGKVKPLLREFKLLAEQLGRKNDLAMLARQFAPRPSAATKPLRATLQLLLDAREADFTTAAEQSGQRLYARKFKAYAQQIWPE